MSPAAEAKASLIRRQVSGGRREPSDLPLVMMTSGYTRWSRTISLIALMTEGRVKAINLEIA
ncbi:hypothetical protein BACCOP_00200, partial [Phocaeicola coprocola DSM 17136]